VYKGKIKAEKNLFKYALFVSFFPQLVAGPIERSENLLTQIQNIHNQKRISYEKFTNGFILMLFGYFQKIVISDKLGVFVDNVFAAPEQYNSIILILGAAAFTIQIYCDFGGYSNIAIGAAQVLGFDMMENFNAPYFAASIKDFWRRWHISLSTWFRDYVYIPLGGNRKGTIRTYINLMITFLVSGLWHGAHVHYVVWGGIHGVYQIIGDMERKLIAKIEAKHPVLVNKNVFSFRLLQIMVTFVLAMVAWIFFRAESISAAVVYVKHMCTRPDVGVLFNGAVYSLGINANDARALGFCLLILFLTDLVRYKKGLRIEKYLCTQNLWFKWAVLFTLIICIVVFGEYGLNYDAAEFIYFQF
jgi:D-alanyl-lipoteichoic acid acyltransferase DltB (MBOAT superfamily)